MPIDRTARNRALTPAPLAFLAGLGLFVFTETVADNDLWGHLRFGQDILRAGAVPRTDPYSYRTGGRRWVNHEWLAEVVFARVYGHAGPAGLVALKAGVGQVVLLACYAHLRRRGMGTIAALGLLGLTAVPLWMGLGTIRPQLFTYAGFLLLVLLIERGRPGREVWLLPAPVVVAFWVNLHGGVLAGVGVVGLWGAARLVQWSRRADRSPARRVRGVVEVAVVVAAVGLSLLVNPYGPALPAFLLREGTVPRPEILEWQPLGVMSLPGVVYLVLVACAAVGLAASRRERDLAAVMILGVTAILPVVSARHFPLFALAVVVLAGGHLADAWDRLRPPRAPRESTARWASAALAVSAIPLAALGLAQGGRIRLDPRYFPFPARAVAVLARGNAAGNLAVPFDWGEYAIWHLGPRVKVSMDGRRETVYSRESYRQSLDFERGTGDWDALLKGKPADLVLAPSGSPTANLMDRTAGWLPVFRDRQSKLYVREGSPLLDALVNQPVPELPDDGAGLTFPARGPASHGARR